LPEIWVLTDGKPGHVNQSLGLAEALKRLRPELGFRQLDVSAGWRLLFKPETPRLIISAGRRTHLWSWLCKLRYGAKNLVLMRPSLPQFCFDLILAPEHDGIGNNNPRVVETRGALNRMVPGEKIRGSSLVLVGGPSKHVVWDEDRVLRQIRSIVEANSDSQLRIATSRRTPLGFVGRLGELGNIELINPESVNSMWLPSTLAATEQVWVTSDSVSMVFEALSAGCAVSLISLESVPNSRTQQGMQLLLDSGLVNLSSDGNPRLNGAPLAEAKRCAEFILEKGWL